MKCFTTMNYVLLVQTVWISSQCCVQNYGVRVRAIACGHNVSDPIVNLIFLLFQHVLQNHRCPKYCGDFFAKKYEEDAPDMISYSKK